MIKTNTGEHIAQEPHDAEHCKINEAPHNHPETDCGHYVPSGPGVDLVDSSAPGNDDTVRREDAETGPGVQIDNTVTGPGTGL